MPDRGDPADLLTGVLQNELGGRPADPAALQPAGQLLRVDPMGTAGQHQQRRVVDGEHEAVGDRPDLAPQHLGRRRRGRHRLGERAQLRLNAGGAQRGLHPIGGRRNHSRIVCRLARLPISA
jgi:hypothetical protein